MQPRLDGDISVLAGKVPGFQDGVCVGNAELSQRRRLDGEGGKSSSLLEKEKERGN